jgi:hypothetical protein
MIWGDSPKPALHACLYEIECGLFCVTYRSGASVADLHKLPIYQLGTCEFVARQRLEACARALGYQTIIWHGIDSPLPDHLPEPVRRTPSWVALPRVSLAPVPLPARSTESTIAKVSRI